MRHILLAGPVTVQAFGVVETTASGSLVPSPRLPDRLPPHRWRAVAGAVDLAAVAVTANEYLGPATGTEEESARRFHRWRSMSRQRSSTGLSVLWNTRPAPVHSTAWGTASVWTWRFEPMSCRFLWRSLSTASRTWLSSLVACLDPAPPPAAARQRARFQSPYGLLPTRPLPPSIPPKTRNRSFLRISRPVASPTSWRQVYADSRSRPHLA